MTSIHATFAERGLVRPLDARVFAGVCSGLARRFGVQPWLVRLVFVASCFVLPGSQALAYPVLWVLMPAEQRRPQRQTVLVVGSGGYAEDGR